MPSFEIVAAADIDPARLRAAFSAAFADYLIGDFVARAQAVGGAALERLGLERLPLHQHWLRRTLA